MQRGPVAYRAHGLYVDRPHGIGSLRERPWAYVVYRALHKQNYAVKYGVELRWEPRYSPSRADEMVDPAATVPLNSA